VVVSIALVAMIQFGVMALRLPSPTFFNNEIVSRKYGDILRLHAAEEVEVVVVGHSHAVMSVNPRQLEQSTRLTTYNCAIPTTDLRTQSMLVRDFIVPHFKPKVILWHIDPQVQSGFRSNRNIIDSDGFQIQQHRLGHYGIPFLKDALPNQKRSIEGWILALVNRRDERYDAYGFRASPERHSDAKARFNDPAVEAIRKQRQRWRFPVSPVIDQLDKGGLILPELEHADKQPLWEAFLGALRRASERDVAVWAFSAPRSRDGYAPHSWLGGVLRKGEFDPDIARLEQILSQFEIPYANFRYYPDISDEDHAFVDLQHLNRDGANRVSDLILQHFWHGQEIPADYRGVISPAERRLLDASW
jgi:hypothetical protein